MAVERRNRVDTQQRNGLGAADQDTAAWPGGPLLHAKGSLRVACPACGSRLRLGRLHFAGMPMLVECACGGCGGAYWLDWPAGHALLHPTLVDAATGAVHFDGLDWYPRRVARCVATRARPVHAGLRVRRREPASSRALVVDCLDFLYGHSLLKLLGTLSDAARRPGADLVVLAPRSLGWLVPDSVAAHVEVDLAPARADEWVEGLDEATRRVLDSYREIAIAPAVSQPPLDRADLTALLGRGSAPQPFWERRDADRAPLVGLILREDRVWEGPSRRLTPRVAGRISPALRRREHVRRQNACFAAVVRRVRASVPQARFAVMGIGRAGGLPAEVADLRRPAAELTAEHEHAWLETYAQCRVVVGVHGSNMLLPSALAGAVVELLPDEKLRNVAQDLVLADEDAREPKLCLFRYRVLPLRTSVETVAATVASVLTDAAEHHRNMVENSAAHARAGWPRPVTWRPLQPARR